MRGGTASTGATVDPTAGGREVRFAPGESASEPRLRVAWFSHRAQLGGAELGLLDGCRALRTRDVSSVAVLPEQGPLMERLEADGIPTYVAPFHWWMSSTGAPRWRARNLAGHADRRTWRRLLRVLDEIDPDVVITNTSTFAAAAVAARIRHIPHVWYVREFGLEDHDLRFDLGAALSYRAIGRLSQSVIVVSRAVGDHLGRHGLGDKIRHVRYGIEAPATATAVPRPSEGLLLVQVGTVTPKKGQQDAVRAVRVLQDRGIEAHLWLQGSEGEVRGEGIRAIARREGVANRVEIIPFRDPFPTLAAADVVLTCSVKEAFGRTTLEAMKFGKPVVGTNSGGTPELIRDGWNGYLYTPGDSAELADKIARFDEHPDLLETLGRNGRERAATEFTRANYGEDLASIVRAACTADRRRTPR